MTTVSRQSAFWAVVALGLNTFAQDGGKVLGFPAEWSRALRLSPIVCIVDTLGVLFSIAFFSYQTRSLKDGFTLAARYRCLTEDDPTEPKVERTWWFRFSVFALGAMPQAVKILGMGGIPLMKTWGMSYLVSFLVLEGLDLLQAQRHGDYHALEQHVAVLDKYMWLTGRLATYTQAMCFVVEVLIISMAYIAHQWDLEPSKSLPLPEPGNVTYEMTLCIKHTSYGFMVSLSPIVLNRAISFLFEPIRGRSLNDSVEVIQILLLVASTFLAGLGVVLNGLGSIRTSRDFFIQAAVLASLLTFFVFIFCTDKLRWFREHFRSFRKLFGIQRYERKGGSFPLLFTAGNIAGIICYYMYTYDPSSTYKPPWTEYLG